jgi:hypothetical protein
VLSVVWTFEKAHNPKIAGSNPARYLIYYPTIAYKIQKNLNTLRLSARRSRQFCQVLFVVWASVHTHDPNNGGSVPYSISKSQKNVKTKWSSTYSTTVLIFASETALPGSHGRTRHKSRLFQQDTEDQLKTETLPFETVMQHIKTCPFWKLMSCFIFLDEESWRLDV